MKENNILLRTTTIGLDEYNRLVSRADDNASTIGSLREQVNQLRNDLEKKASADPQVKVIHYNMRYDEYSDDSWKEQSGVEFMNLSDVKSMMKDSLKKEVEKETNELKSEIENQKYTIKILQSSNESLEDKITSLNKAATKIKAKSNEEVNDLKEEQTKREKELQKAYTNDVKAYKETITELEEEIQKVKDSKTDAEIEAKRNEEIVTLKTRITDLEKLINNLKGASFLTRTFKMKSLLQERDNAMIEAARLERRADAVGTTWVKEGGKVRKYDSFTERMNDFYVYFTNSWVKASRW